MMGVLRILITFIAMTALPAAVGTVFAETAEDKSGKLSFCWVAGQMLIWAGFQLVCVPAILAGCSYRQMEGFFGLYVGFLVLVAGGAALLRRRGLKKQNRPEIPRTEGVSRAGLGLWGIFALLLCIQLFLLCFLSYEEGDDAYYVAVTTYNRDAEQMYTKHPYTGESTGLDARHALAPFPIWVSVISSLSGLSGAAAAHTAVPLVLVPMTYCLYYLIGKRLIGKEAKDWHTPLYLCFTALLIFFGGYSVYSAENFLLVRGAQGKSVLANLVIPFLFLLMLHLAQKQERREKEGALFWILTVASVTAGCLCSTLGSLLICILLGISVLCVSVSYRRWGILARVALCMVPSAVFAYLYVTM